MTTCSDQPPPSILNQLQDNLLKLKQHQGKMYLKRIKKFKTQHGSLNY